MHRAITAAFAVLVAGSLATPGAAQAKGDDKNDKQDKKSSYIVVLRDDTPDSKAVADDQADDDEAESGTSDVKHVYNTALKGYSAEMTAKKAAKLARDPRVTSVQPDYEVRLAAQTLPTGINRVDAELSSTLAGNGSGSVNVGVAVIDTGITTSQPDLNVQAGKNCVLGLGGTNDDNGHGSHVSGTIGAKDDGNGVVGVAPGARLYPVKVLSAGGLGLGSWIICGIDWVAANAVSKNIKVANMSLGGGGSDDGNCGLTNNDAEHKAICNAVSKGVTFVAAAGNDGADLSTSAPAAYNEVLTVTAVSDYNGLPGGGAAPTCQPEADDSAAGYSNFTTIGSSDVNHVIAAPGSCIYSTYQGSGFSTLSGTSMASPHVAGAVALCIANGACAGATTPAQIIAKLRADAAAQPAAYGFAGDPSRPNGNRYYGHLLSAAAY